MVALVSRIQDLAGAIRDKLNQMNTSLRPAAVTIVVDGGGVVVTNGIKLDVSIPFDCTITGWTLLADQVGSATFDLWKTDYANAPPNQGNSIVGNAYPAINSVAKAHSNTLDGWTTTIQKDDVIRVNVSSAVIVNRLTLILQVMRT